MRSLLSRILTYHKEVRIREMVAGNLTGAECWPPWTVTKSSDDRGSQPTETKEGTKCSSRLCRNATFGAHEKAQLVMPSRPNFVGTVSWKLVRKHLV